MKNKIVENKNRTRIYKNCISHIYNWFIYMVPFK